MVGTGLTDPYLKLDWAKRHLEALDADLKIFHESKPCRFSSQDDLKNQRHILSVDLADVPDNICLRCGDAFYCMRASLDQLVWRLAKLTVTIPDRTQFPIVENWDSDSLGRFKKHLIGVPDDAVAIIRDLQPANRPASVKENLLWRLNAMCNLDKHRRIPANGSEVQFFLPTATDPSLITFETFDNYGIFSVPLAHKGKLDMHPEVTLQVIFGDATSGVRVGPDDILAIYEFLSNSVLPRFVRFFT